MSKYNAKKVEVDGIIFDSSAEAEYYKVLKGKGVEFEIQPKFLLQEATELDGEKLREISYIADFRVGNLVIDIKGVQTEAFKMKAKLFKNKYKHLKLVCLTKCPIKYSNHSHDGFINSDELKKLRAKEKSKIPKENKENLKIIREKILILKKFLEINKKEKLVNSTDAIKEKIARLTFEKSKLKIS